DDDEQEARTGARSARVATPTTMRRARERRAGRRDMVVLDSVGVGREREREGGSVRRGGARRRGRRIVVGVATLALLAPVLASCSSSS
ncbi:hypothetical protein DZF92_17880, partial [Clavibacter michiganensis subsp. insidiosus]